MIDFPNGLTIRDGIKYVTLASLILLSQSCSDDDSQTLKDTTAPQVAFTDLTDGQNVWGTVTAAVNASDDQGIEKVEVYVDGTLFSTLTAAPYTLSWNTTSTADGQHTVKAVVTDKDGNTADKAVTVTVQNTLVTITIKSEMLAAGERGFVFLSGPDGKLITATEYQNGQKLTLKADAYNEKDFFLTEVFIESNNYVNARTYSHFARNSTWTLTDFSSIDPDPSPAIGSTTLNFSNAAAQTEYFMVSNGGSTSASSDIAQSLISLSRSPSKLYVTKYSPGSFIPLAYNLYSNLTVNGTSNINLAAVTKALTKGAVLVPENTTSMAFSIKAYPVANDFSEYYTLNSTYFSAGDAPVPAGQTIDYYYPGAAFAAYSSMLEAESDERSIIRYTNHGSSITASSDLFTYNSNFKFANNTITYSVSGDWDVAGIYFEGSKSLWSYILTAGENQVIPSLQVPSLLNNWNFPGLDRPEEVNFINFETINGYSALLDYGRSSTYGWDELLDKHIGYTEVIANVPASNGRTQKGKNKHKGFTAK